MVRRLRWIVLACLAAGSIGREIVAMPAEAVPKLVVLVRHGHKDSPGAPLTNYNLSSRGLVDALHLGHLLRACVVPPGPLALASYGFDGRTGKNARSYQTLVPLAVFTGRNIRVFAAAENRSEQIGRELLIAPELAGSTLVMAWEHRRLPSLARGLGWAQMPGIGDDDFDGLWLLRYSGARGEPEVSQLSQAELRSRACFTAAGSAGHPLRRLAGQLLQPIQ
jgi:hypothetical protein